LGKEYRSLSSSLCNFLHSPVTSSLLGQILASTPYIIICILLIAREMHNIKF
jgi:hypothetical protein